MNGATTNSRYLRRAKLLQRKCFYRGIWRKNGQTVDLTGLGLRTTQEALQRDYEPIPGNLIMTVLMADGNFKSAAVTNAIAMLGPGFEGITDEKGQITFIAQETDVTKAVGEMYKAREAALRKA